MKHEKDKKPIVVTMVPMVVGLRFPNLDTTKPEATEISTILSHWGVEHLLYFMHRKDLILNSLQ